MKKGPSRLTKIRKSTFHRLYQSKDLVTCKNLPRGKDICFVPQPYPGVTLNSGPIVFHSLGYTLARGKYRQKLPRGRKLPRSATRGNFPTPG